MELRLSTFHSVFSMRKVRRGRNSLPRQIGKTVNSRYNPLQISNYRFSRECRIRMGEVLNHSPTALQGRHRNSPGRKPWVDGERLSGPALGPAQGSRPGLFLCRPCRAKTLKNKIYPFHCYSLYCSWNKVIRLNRLGGIHYY